MTLHLGYMRIMNFNVCLFLCVVVAVVIAICVLVFMWICLMCAKKSHARTPAHAHKVWNACPHKVRYAHTPARGAKRTSARTHFYSFFSVLLWKEWVLHNIVHSFLLGYHLFFFIFFDKCWKWQRETWEKINKLFCEFSF